MKLIHLSLCVFALIALVAAHPTDSFLDDESFDARPVAPVKRRFFKKLGKKIVDTGKKGVDFVADTGKKGVDKVKDKAKEAYNKAKEGLKQVADLARDALSAIIWKIVPSKLKNAIESSISQSKKNMPFDSISSLKAPLKNYMDKVFCDSCSLGPLLKLLKKYALGDGGKQLNAAVGQYTSDWITNPFKKPSHKKIAQILGDFGKDVEKVRKNGKRDETGDAALNIAREYIQDNNRRLRKVMNEIRDTTDRYNITRRDASEKQGMGFWTLDLDASLIGGAQLLFGMAINHHDHQAYFMICTHYALGAQVGASAGISGGYDWSSTGEDYLWEKNWKGGYSGSFSVSADFYAGFELGFGSSQVFGHALGGGKMGFDEFKLGQVQFGVSGGLGGGPYNFLQGRCWTWK